MPMSSATARPSYVGPTTFPLLAAAHVRALLPVPRLPRRRRRAGQAESVAGEAVDEIVGHFANVAQLPSREPHWTRFDPTKDSFMTFALSSARMIPPFRQYTSLRLLKSGGCVLTSAA